MGLPWHVSENGTRIGAWVFIDSPGHLLYGRSGFAMLKSLLAAGAGRGGCCCFGFMMTTVSSSEDVESMSAEASLAVMVCRRGPPLWGTVPFRAL
jgi:hypothetical protein